jgi:hypothetical protein
MMKQQFLRCDTLIFPIEEIAVVDYSQVEELIVTGLLKSGKTFVATDIHAIELIMAVKPSVLEGRKLKWARHVWSFHNLIAHPLMQILAFMRFYNAAFWLHDATVPKPTGKKEKAK